MAQSNENSIEALKKLMSQIAQIAVLPDADMEFVSNLQLTIRDQILAQTQALTQGASSPGGGMPQASPPTPPPMPPPGSLESPGGMPGGPPPLPGGGGSMGLASSPNPDELRRLLSTAGGG